ncbi:MAG: DUF4382 domain-containing protein [Marinifilaceae bacterium]
MEKFKLLTSALLIVMVSFMVGCSDDNVKLKTPFELRLTDAPATYDKVNIDIQEIQIHTADNEEDGEWTNLPLTKVGVYDLLQFNNGMDTLMVDTELPSGRISQMRLILGNKNSVVVNGEEIPLNTPSAQTSGLKFQINAELLGGITYRLWIDFDAARSIVATGNGKYNLKPVIRTFNEATSGAIKGQVNPADAATEVQAITGVDTLATFPEADGTFHFLGTQAGTYKLRFLPAENYVEKVKEEVIVENGKVTNLEVIEMETSTTDTNE